MLKWLCSVKNGLKLNLLLLQICSWKFWSRQVIFVIYLKDLIYQLRDVVKDDIKNLIDTKNDDVGDVSDLLPKHIKLIKEIINDANFLNANTITVQAKATSIPLHQLKKIHNISQEDRIEAENKLVKTKNIFKFNNVSQGKKKLASVKVSPLSTIISNLRTQFGSLVEELEEMYVAFSVFEAPCGLMEKKQIC